jgi:hypothetical protein
VSQIVFDEQGRSVDANSAWQRRTPHLQLEVFVRFAQRNMGWVTVELRTSGVRVTFWPTRVHSAAIAEAMNWLFDHRPERVLVCTEYPHRPQQHRIHKSAQSAIQDIVDQLFAVQTPADLTRTAVQIDHGVSAQPFRTLLELRAESEVFSEERYATVFLGAFRDRYLILSPDPFNDLLVFKMGLGYSVLDKRWVAQASGRRFSDQPDVGYGRWAADAYREVGDRGAPVLEDVDIVLRQRGTPVSRARYQRLILPLKCKVSGKTLLLGATLMRDQCLVPPQVRQKGRRVL